MDENFVLNDVQDLMRTLEVIRESVTNGSDREEWYPAEAFPADDDARRHFGCDQLKVIANFRERVVFVTAEDGCGNSHGYLVEMLFAGVGNVLASRAWRSWGPGVYRCPALSKLEDDDWERILFWLLCKAQESKVHADKPQACKEHPSHVADNNAFPPPVLKHDAFFSNEAEILSFLPPGYGLVVVSQGSKGLKVWGEPQRLGSHDLLKLLAGASTYYDEGVSKAYVIARE